MSAFNLLSRLIKDASLRTGIGERRFFSRYPYMYEPNQLIFMTECINAVRDVRGCFVEAGCAYGTTTVFLNRFMKSMAIDRDYFAIDTFSGFVAGQIDHEVGERGKHASHFKGVFSENRKAWFDRTMALNGLERVRSFEADVADFDFSAVAPIAFCLLDVDLYQPIRNALPKIFAALSPGGIIVVDDCQPDAPWDGALQAYEEFIREKGLQHEIVAVKLGLIRGSALERPP
jgi:SAM-dependent methyltransferase